MNSEARVPFVARSRKPLCAPTAAGPEHHYDSSMQLWVCAQTGIPLVLRHAQQDKGSLAASEFGETTLTKTHEGADQSEGRVDGEVVSALSSGYGGMSASQFGETFITRTGEGADQTERTVGD